MIKGNYTGLYASVKGRSYGDEWELNYFENKYGKYWVLKEKDLDSREEEDLVLVTGIPDAKERFTFEEF